MKIIKKLLLLILITFLACALVALGYYFAVTKNVALNSERLLFTEKTVTLYDGNNHLIQGVSNATVKQSTSISDIPTHVQRAFIDTEDRRFYKHGGYDVKGIARALFHNLKSGSCKEGASTISQQLIKNTHLTQEKTIKRKLQEWKLTRALEKTYTKEEILERYLNSIYFGHRCFGITSAADFYFGKTPTDLTIAEGAMLAGLVKAPNHYSPFKNAEACYRRRGIVLSAMSTCGSITQTQQKEAHNVPLPTASPSKQDEGYLQFVFDELTTISEKYQFKIGGNLQIYTYLDAKLQNQIEKIAEEYAESDKTMLVLDGQTHGFKACVSSVGNLQRLPGSLIKPLLVYAPAIEEDILSPATPILDEKINYNGYAPENYDNTYHGYVSTRECIAKSLNIPAVKVLESLGIAKGTAYLEKLGLPVEKEDQSLAFALGGMKKGYTLRELLSAYSTFQNMGIYHENNFISQIKINGATVYAKSKDNARIFSEETAYLMTDMLKTTANTGTAKKLRTLPFEIAAKTGTVGTNKGNTDAYALSYTPWDCVGVWLGNADNGEITCTGGGTPCNFLYQINQALYETYANRGRSIPTFPSSKGILSLPLDKTAYYDTHTLSVADDMAPENYRVYELFKKNAIPLNKSTSFSCPTIVSPTLQIKNGEVIITFDKHNPTYYTYHIDRYDYATHTTIYNGEFCPAVIDGKLLPNKNYCYTVTPYYEGHAGNSITLPIVTTLEGEKPKLSDKEILSKEWWEY